MLAQAFTSATSAERPMERLAPSSMGWCNALVLPTSRMSSGVYTVSEYQCMKVYRTPDMSVFPSHIIREQVVVVLAVAAT